MPSPNFANCGKQRQHAACGQPLLPTGGTPPGIVSGVSKVAAFFDLDKTIIATSTSAAFTRPLYDGGLVSRGDVLKTAVNHGLYLMGSADAEKTERLRKQLSELATGWEVEKVKQIVADGMAEHINPYVYQEALNLINEHHELGHDVVIISASASEFVEPIAKLLGADHYVSSVLSVEDGKYTGEIEFYAYGEFKAEAITELAEKYNYDLARSFAYSDSITDVPMLSAVGFGTVINPDRTLRRLAAEHGWNMLSFVKPVSLRASVGTHVSHIPQHVGHARDRIVAIPERVQGGRDRHLETRERRVTEGRTKSSTRNPPTGSIPIVSTITDAIPIVVKDNPKKSAAIAAGIAAAGVAFAASSRKSE